ncbi:nipped-B-like protein [Dysidea avara]|uniref:nipped-B-like protein n=1 Tax=Dysidea avara TaxID=196820 RepID=UPI003320782E
MESTGFNRSLLTSLVGTKPLNDLLPDLPLPSHLPTRLETAIYSGTPLHDVNEINKLLNSQQDPVVVQQMASVLCEVDTGFLKFKKNVAPPLVSNHPLLVKTLLQVAPDAFRCHVDVNKMDIAGLPMPSTQTADQNAKPPAAVQTSGSPCTYSQIRAGKVAMAASKSVDSVPETAKTDGQIASEERLVMDQSVVQHNVPTGGKHQKKRKRSTDEVSMVVSIKRSKLSSLNIEQKSTKLKKKKKKTDLNEHNYKISISRDLLNHNIRLSSPQDDDHSPPVPMIRQEVVPTPVVDEPVKKSKKHKEKKVKRRMLLPVQDAAQSNALKAYNHLLEAVFQHAEKWEISDIKESDEDVTISSELLLPHRVVSNIATQTCMLRHHGIIHQVQASSLVQIIDIMEKHVTDSKQLFLMQSLHCDEDPRMWKELGKERILRSCEATLVILFIATSPQVPKQVQMEEAFETIITMTKFQLENNVYPEFDPVYRVDPSGKESGLLPKLKRKTGMGSTGGKREILPIYNKMVEIFEGLAELIEKQTLPDTTILRVSSLGITPFFVEDISALQLSALRLIRAVFSKYDRHRALILEDIMHSLTRLPTSKRSLRNYKITNEYSIQMMTALVLQLIHSVINCKPKEDQQKQSTDNTPNSADSVKETPVNESLVEEVMLNSYEMACKTAQNFLSEFLKKCISSKEEDFKTIFDNFVQDLLITLNHPEWPAAELVVTQLGILLVHTFGMRSNDQSLRVLALDHLGVIAARLRKDAVTSTKQDNDAIIEILSKVLQCRMESKTPSPTEIGQLDAFSENAQHLQKALVYHLFRKSTINPACNFARDFHLAQWLKDIQLEVEKSMKNPSDSKKDTSEIFKTAQQKRSFLSSLRKPQKNFKILEESIDDAGAMIVTRYLSSFRALSKSFDFYLLQLLKVLNEPAVHVRTKAMKALSVIVAADPTILSRNEMQVSVRKRLGDQSTLVREATVDLLGRFILTQPEISLQYYDMLSERILDSGVSVRKRVIKILRDICIHMPDFPKLTDCHVKLLRRITDEEGVKLLVTGAFHQLWFTNASTGTDDELIQKVKSIIAVVGSCKDTGNDWFELLLQQLLKSEDTGTINATLKAFQKIVDCLMKVVLALDEKGIFDGEKFHLANCMSTLTIFCKVKPRLMLKHATTLQPYLSTQCTNQEDVMVVHYVASILELVVPLIDHPSEMFLASLEEDIIKLTMKQGQMVVQSCLSCLSAIVNRVTKNFKLIKDSFHKFYDLLESVRTIHLKDKRNPKLVSLRPSILRSLFTVGLFCKHFDIDAISQKTSPKSPSLVKTRVLPLLMYFTSYDHAETQLKAVTGIGFLCIRYPDLMLQEHIKKLYQSWLSSPTIPKKCQILKNLLAHFNAEETRLQEADHEWYAEAQDLISIGDKNASISSAAAQLFLQDIFASFFTVHLQVRLTSLTVLNLILRQGLVHPAQCIPYLITMSTDSESSVRLKAEQLMNEIDSKYGTFMQTQLQAGVKKSYEFQKLIASDVVRGCTGQSTNPHCKIAHLYSLIRSHKQHRRAFLKSLLRHFEDIKSPAGWLLYLADIMAFLPYSTLEEPLFVVHHVEMTLSVTGSSILQQFKEALGINATHDDDTETMDSLGQKVENLSPLNVCCSNSQGCMLLLVLKQHLKQLYGLTDSKCQQYSPTESNTKAYDKAPTRKQGVVFNPEFIINMLKAENSKKKVIRSKEECLTIYFQFKNLLNSLDPFEHDEDDSDDKDIPPPTVPAVAQTTTDVKVEVANADGPITRKSSRSRMSSGSSTGSTGGNTSKKRSHKKGGESSSSKKKKRIVSTDSSDDEGDPEFRIH